MGLKIAIRIHTQLEGLRRHAWLCSAGTFITLGWLRRSGRNLLINPIDAQSQLEAITTLQAAVLAILARRRKVTGERTEKPLLATKRVDVSADALPHAVETEPKKRTAVGSETVAAHVAVSIDRAPSDDRTTRDRDSDCCTDR